MKRSVTDKSSVGGGENEREFVSVMLLTGRNTMSSEDENDEDWVYDGYAKYNVYEKIQRVPHDMPCWHVFCVDHIADSEPFFDDMSAWIPLELFGSHTVTSLSLSIYEEWSRDNINDMREIMHRNEVQTLELRHDRGLYTAWGICRGLSSLRTLIICTEYDKFTLDGSALASLPHLRSLTIKCWEMDATEIIEQLVDVAHNIPLLESVKVMNNSGNTLCDSDTIEKMAKAWPNLRTIELDVGWQLTGFHLNALKECRSLERLWARHFGEIIDRHLAGLMVKGYFRKLDISPLIGDCPDYDRHLWFLRCALKGECVISELRVFDSEHAMEQVIPILFLGCVQTVIFDSTDRGAFFDVVVFSTCSEIVLPNTAIHTNLMSQFETPNPLVRISRISYEYDNARGYVRYTIERLPPVDHLVRALAQYLPWELCLMVAMELCEMPDSSYALFDDCLRHMQKIRMWDSIRLK